MSTIEDRNNAGQTDLATQGRRELVAPEQPSLYPSQSASISPDALLPRPQRRPRKAKADRGLPPDGELHKLAAAYLERQTKHWPKLAEVGLLPEASDLAICQMVEDFKERHRTGSVDVAGVRPFLKRCPKAGGNYNRFSCDNSSPTSNLDQMVKSLDKAHDEGRFIPWQYVFADYSVTGLDASRQGYSSYKAILAEKDHFIETTYIDDFTRASRDEIEWWRLAAVSKRLNKRMIGASDGFDLSNPNSDVLITMFGLVSRLFIKSLREKVKRGMSGAARRGTCLGKPSLGFTRRVRRDQHGNVVYGSDGLPIHEICIDPATREFRRLLYELFVEKNWSIYKIARHFNKLKVEGWDGWAVGTIENLLRSPASIGVFIWNKTRREYDVETGKWQVVKNPHSEWTVNYDQNLAIVSKDWWRAARRKLAAIRKASPMTGRRLSRNQASATTLFSGTLFCGYCGQELTLIRSTVKYKQMGCSRGTTGTHDCELSASKSVRAIEECLLRYMRDHLLAEAEAEELVAKANVFLEEESRKPQIDTAPLKATARNLEARIKKLVLCVEAEPDENLCAGYDRRIKELQKELNDVRSKIQHAERQNRRGAVKPLDLNQVMAYLGEIRATLNQNIPVAAEAIRTLTGPIKIRQQAIPGRKHGARWIATFSPDLVRALRSLAKDDPGISALASGVSAEPQSVEVVVDNTPKYQLLAPVFKRMREKGASIQTIARAHQMGSQYVAALLDSAETGNRPQWRPAGAKQSRRGRRGNKGRNPAKYVEIAEEVARLHDEEKIPFAQIAARLKVCDSTVQRAYDYARPNAVRKAAENGEEPRRGPRVEHGGPKRGEIREMLRAGEKPATIAAKLNCGTSTVYRVRRWLEAESNTDEAA